MADQHLERGVDFDQNRFCCSVCLELLKDPVTTPCGHNYCKNCLEGFWNYEEAKGEYSCPQCRETFNLRPALRRNNMLAEVVQMLKSTSTQQACPPAAASYAGPADVSCDFCPDTRRNKATMSCLACLASYCPAHLKPHHSVLVLQKHQLVSATIPLQEKMCTKHNKLMEVYCQTDKKCICYLCVIDEHKGHCTVSAAAERAEEQKQLNMTQKKVQEKEKELNELLRALKDFKSCIQPAVENCDKVFDELISSIKTRCTLAKQMIKARQHSAVNQAEDLQLQLEEEIAKLKAKDGKLKVLSHMDDHIHFIQTFRSLPPSGESPDWQPGSVVPPQLPMFKAVTDCASNVIDDMESLLQDTRPRICASVSTLDVVLPPVPNTRAGFLRYGRSLTLDENLVSRHLSISHEYRRVTNDTRSNCSHLNKFTNLMQGLCREGLSERCYWEVSWSGGAWSVAVSYKDVRSTSNLEFGKNDSSWSLECYPHGYTFRHDSGATEVSGPRSSRIGVFLDYKKGTMCFYSISNAMTLIHKEHATFKQPLYPGLGLKDGSRGNYAELIKLK